VSMFTPNKMIPLNDREPGAIAPVAIKQLQAYENVAKTWPIGFIFQDDRWCNVCEWCGQNIWFERDINGVEYYYSAPEILALIVAHIRQVHSEVTNGNDQKTG
jgi:hypothetical protein